MNMIPPHGPYRRFQELAEQLHADTSATQRDRFESASVPGLCEIQRHADITKIIDAHTSREEKAARLLRRAREAMSFTDYRTIWQALRAMEDVYAKAEGDITIPHQRERDYICVMATGLIFGKFYEARELTKEWPNKIHTTKLDDAFASLIDGVMHYRTQRNHRYREGREEFQDAAQKLQSALDGFDASKTNIAPYHRAQAHYYLSKCLRRLGEWQDAEMHLNQSLDMLKGVPGCEFEYICMTKDAADFRRHENDLPGADLILNDVYKNQLQAIAEGKGGELRLVSTALKRASLSLSLERPRKAQDYAHTALSHLVSHFGGQVAHHNFYQAVAQIKSAAHEMMDPELGPWTNEP